MTPMDLVELSEFDKDHYNRFVAQQPSGSFLQSWEWGMWQKKLGREPYRFLLEDGNRIVASLQVIKSPLPMGKYYLYLPYGPVVEKNFKFQISNFKYLLQELQQKFPGAVFIRIETKDRIEGLLSIAKKTTNIQPGKTLIIDLSKSEEQLLAEMHQKTRYNIKLAQRHGVQVVSEPLVVPGHGLYVKEALDLITQTADRQDFQTFPRAYYEQFLDYFALQNSGGDVKIYLYKALLDRELLTAAIMVDFGNTRTYLFGGSAAHHREAMAPHLLHFTAMLDAKRSGLNFYDFWGVETASGDQPGFVRFKMGFAPQGSTIEYPGAYDIAHRKPLYHAYKTLRRVNRTWLYMKMLRKKF
jgi:lipid II:glycine glycyltransferase (peptidoglycan interpeptide bridge formation enzyme)